MPIVCGSAGVGMMTRTMAGSAKPEQTWSQEADGTIKVHTSTTLKKTDIAFKLGVEFDEHRADGEVCKVRTKAHINFNCTTVH